MHVLITGGAGFIGSHVAQWHIERGDRVHIVDDLSTGRRENLDWAANNPNLHFDHEDIRRWPGLDAATQWADRIYHLAAVVGVKRVLQDPVRVVDVNIHTTDYLLQCVQKSSWRPEILIRRARKCMPTIPTPSSRKTRISSCAPERPCAGAMPSASSPTLFGYASDSDRIVTITWGATGSLRIDNRLYLEAGGFTDMLRARRGSGLDRLDGGRRASVYRAFAGVRGALSDNLWGSLRFGSALTSDGDRQFYYAAAADYRPYDGVQIRFNADHDYHAVSPRAISRNIHRYNHEISVSWQLPDLRHQIVVSAGYAVFSDGNRRYAIAVEPRRAILRSQHLNLDIGVSGRWSGFEHDLNNGYYDPNLYEQYLAVLYGYVKLSDDDGISFAIAPGVNKDDRQKRYTFSGYLNAEATFGIARDWQLRIAGGAGLSIGVAESTTYHRAYGLARLQRRF